MATLADLKKIYVSHDADGNGVLELDEAEQAYKALGSHAKHFDNFEAEFKKIAKNGTITFDDFKHFSNVNY
uniref:EF-hand domain-containing protein n=1 Tax=Acrobeloides nanus TaxID=290746 RepID=A0A914E5S5_9BILA